MPGYQDSPAFIALVQASAGAVGGVFASLVLQPVEVAKTRIQLTHSGSASLPRTIVSVMSDEGPLALFNGAGTKAFESGMKNFVYFYIYDAINAIVKRSMHLSVGVKLVLGYVAGIGTAVSTMPLEVLATKIQADKSGSGGALAQARRVIEREGISGLFTGFWYNILLCINPAIQNSIFDRLKAQILEVKGEAGLTALEAFMVGAIAKSIASTTTYPLVRLKTILQAGQEPGVPAPPAGSSPSRNPRGSYGPGTHERPKLERKNSTSDRLQALSLREDAPVSGQSLFARFMELYRGIGSTLTKSTLQAAVLLMTKDQVASFVAKFFKITAKVFFRKSGALKLGAISGRPLAS